MAAVLGLPGSAREGSLPDPAPSTASAIDFARDIRPILENRCLRCHGEEKAAGGLRLDTVEGARAGGYSGGRILGGELGENELWLRITTDLEDNRMPRGEAPLPEHEIDLLRRWIEQGARWETGPGPAVEAPSTSATGAFGLIRGVVEGRAPVLLGILLLCLLSLRARRSIIGGGGGKTSRVLARFGSGHAAALILLLLVEALLDENEVLGRRIAQVKGSAALEHRHIFGSPPRPFRPEGERGTASLYFRGNCERGPHLFNNGNYRTATLRLRLVDREGHPVEVGDRVPDGGLAAELEIARAPHTREGMFADRLMSGVFLTETHYPDRVTRLTGRTVVLDTVEPGRTWRARYPIEGGEAGHGRLEGLIYLYLNLRTDGNPFFPVVHYGISYDLHLRHGILEAGSELWLGNLYWTPRLEIPRPGAVPIRQWFDVEPIPVIPDPVPEPSPSGPPPVLPEPPGRPIGA